MAPGCDALGREAPGREAPGRQDARPQRAKNGVGTRLDHAFRLVLHGVLEGGRQLSAHLRARAAAVSTGRVLAPGGGGLNGAADLDPGGGHPLVTACGTTSRESPKI